MKKITLTICTIILTTLLFAQSPHGFKYQAVVRDPAGMLLAEKAVSFRISIIQASTSGTVVYKETFSTTTNKLGVVTLEIGSGAPISGSGIFENIEWHKDIYYLRIELDASGGTNYVLMGVSQLLSVPYALYAEKASYSMVDHDTSATNELQNLSINNYKLSISKGNALNLPVSDSSMTNEIQQLTFFNDTLQLDKNGGYVYLGKYDNTKAINNLLLKVISDSSYMMNYHNTNLQNLSDNVFLAINKEEVKRFVEDSLLRAKIISDSTFLKNRINDNLIYIQAEQIFRINGDNALYVKLDSDSTYLKGRIDNTNAQLVQETTNRSNADNNLLSNITTETNARIIGDNSIRSKMSADSATLTGMLNNTNTNLSSEISNRIAGDNSLKTKQISDSSYLKGLITTETANRISADNTLQSNISSESNSRISADTDIRNKMSTDSSSLQNNLNTLDTNITNETNSRISGINDLKSKQVSDSSYLKNLIDINATAINTETSNRITTDNSIIAKASSDSSYLKGLIVSDSIYLKDLIISDSTYFKNLITTDSIYFKGLITTNSDNISSLSDNLQNNYYSKTDLQSSSGALVHFDNLTNRPTTLSGYGITDATPISHIGATGSAVHGNVSYSDAGFMSVPDKMKLDSVSGYNTGDQTITISGIDTPTISLSANGGKFVLKGAGHTSLSMDNDTISIGSTDTFTTYYAGTGITLSGTTFNSTWSTNGNDIYNNNSGNIGIGTTSPNAASKLEISSTTQGFLPPRMTNTQMLTINAPTTGLTVYNTEEDCPCWYSGSMWVCSKSDFKSCGKIRYGNHIYNTLIMGNKCWMKEDLKIGSMITGSVSSSNNGVIEKYCYNNDSNNCLIYGGLYRWEEAMNYATSSNAFPSGVQGICPQGWHLPSDTEWVSMEYGLYGSNFAGGYLKERSTRHWLSPNTGADNFSGFTAFGAGNRTAGGGFSNLTTIAYYWSSTEFNLTDAKYHSVRYNLSSVTISNLNKSNGVSVRCVKD